jgi:hypothetical protein
LSELTLLQAFSEREEASTWPLGAEFMMMRKKGHIEAETKKFIAKA